MSVTETTDDTIASHVEVIAEVLVARAQKSVWHICLGHLVRADPSHKECSVRDEVRVASHRSNAGLPEAMKAEAGQRDCLAVVVDPSAKSGRQFIAYCPGHGELGRNTSESYAADRCVAHWSAEHADSEAA